MENTKVAEFVSWFDKIRHRTMRVARYVPPDKIDWTYKEGKFTFGDLMRHLASIERWMFAENAQRKPSRYPGHGRDLADGYDETIAFMERMHAESMDIFRGLTDEQFEAKTATPDGAELRVSKWMRSMVEHEVHHRGQIYMMLSMLGVETPPLYGLTEEEVKKRSATSAPR